MTRLLFIVLMTACVSTQALRAPGFSTAPCVTAEPAGDVALTRAATTTVARLFGTQAATCTSTEQIHVRVDSKVGAQGVQVLLVVHAVNAAGLLWQRDFEQTKAGVENAEVLMRDALNAALEDFQRFARLDVSVARVIALPEAALRERVTAWFVATRGLELSNNSAHSLTSTDTQVRVQFVPIDERQTMLEVFEAGRRARDVDTAIADVVDNEASLVAMGGFNIPDVAPLADFAPIRPRAAVADARRVIEKQCEVRLASLDDVAPGAVLLLPDLEGSVQTPLVLQRTVCAALALGHAVTVALDIDAAEQQSLNDWLESNAPPSALLKATFWRRLWQDGRCSRAVFAVLQQLRAWRAEGKPLTVLCADAGVPGNARMASMARRIIAQRTAHPERLIIAYASNTAGRLAVGAEWNATLQPLGYRLAAAGVPVRSFDLAFNSGLRWTCRLFAEGRLRCGTWPVIPADSAIDFDLSHSTTIFRHDPRSRVFTGQVCVGPVTPSPPAVDGFVNEGLRP